VLLEKTQGQIETSQIYWVAFPPAASDLLEGHFKATIPVMITNAIARKISQIKDLDNPPEKGYPFFNSKIFQFPGQLST
jgi:hypothetical protein